MAGGLWHRVDLAQQAFDGRPLAAADIQRQRLHQMAWLVIALPCQGGNGGGLQRLVGLQDADQGVEISHIDIFRREQLAVGLCGQGVLLLLFCELRSKTPEARCIVGLRRDLALGGIQPREAQRALPAQQRQNSRAHGEFGGDPGRVLKQPPPAFESGFQIACTLGQSSQQFERGGGARLLAQEFDGGLGGADPLVGDHQFLQQPFTSGFAMDFVAQGLDQCGIVKLTRGQTQDGLPGSILLGAPCQDQPVFQRHLKAKGPLGNLRQAFTPDHVVGRLLHGGTRHQPGVFKIPVFQEHGVAQGIGLVVKRQARAGLGIGWAFLAGGNKGCATLERRV